MSDLVTHNNQIVPARGNIDNARKLKTALEGEIFTKYNTTTGKKDFYVFISSGSSTENAKYVKIGSEGVAYYRNEVATLPTDLNIAELGAMFKLTAPIAETANNPKLLKGDIAMCVGIDTTTSTPIWIKLSGAGGEATDITFKNAYTRFTQVDPAISKVQDAIVNLVRQPFSVITLDTTKVFTSLDEIKAYALTNADFVKAGSAGILFSLPSSMLIDKVQYQKGDIVYVYSTIYDTDTALTSDLISVAILPGNDIKNMLASVTSTGWARVNSEATDYYATDDAKSSTLADFIKLIGTTKADVDKNGKLFLSQLPDTIIGSIEWQGVLSINVTDETSETSPMSIVDSIPKSRSTTGTSTGKEFTHKGDYWSLSITNSARTKYTKRYSDKYLNYLGMEILYDPSDAANTSVLIRSKTGQTFWMNYSGGTDIQSHEKAYGATSQYLSGLKIYGTTTKNFSQTTDGKAGSRYVSYKYDATTETISLFSSSLAASYPDMIDTEPTNETVNVTLNYDSDNSIYFIIDTSRTIAQVHSGDWLMVEEADATGTVTKASIVHHDQGLVGIKVDDNTYSGTPELLDTETIRVNGQPSNNQIYFDTKEAVPLLNSTLLNDESDTSVIGALVYSNETISGAQIKRHRITASGLVSTNDLIKLASGKLLDLENNGSYASSTGDIAKNVNYKFTYPTVSELIDAGSFTASTTVENTILTIKLPTKSGTIALNEDLDALKAKLASIDENYIPMQGRDANNNLALVDSPLMFIKGPAKATSNANNIIQLKNAVFGANTDNTSISSSTSSNASFLKFDFRELPTTFVLDPTNIGNGPSGAKSTVSLLHEDSVIDGGYWE